MRVLNPRRRHRRKGKPFYSAPGHPLHAYLNAFCEWELAAGFTEHTVNGRRVAITRFIVWCSERGLDKPVEITRPILERYQRMLYQHRKTDGTALSIAAQLVLLNALIAWFRWMVRQNHILYNPASDLDLPRKPKTLPKTILSVVQVEDIINQADVTTPLGIRNRAIMETFYSTGIRRMEMGNLKRYDFDGERGLIIVRQGKGRKDRFVPIGERACKWVERYLFDVRPHLITGHDDHTLFLDDFGGRMNLNSLGDLMRRHVEAAGIITPGACHIFRHAMATHMLENGADIRYIQAILGHENLETTEMYTHVSLNKLKEIHNATHPARLHRQQETAQPTEHDRATLDALLAQDEAA